VMRVMTTTRSAARSLRIHGLVIDSQRTAYKSWALTILGLLTAALLIERKGRSIEMPARGLRIVNEGRFGASNHLAQSVSRVMRELSDPEVVSTTLGRICTPNRDVFPTFDRAVEAIVQFGKEREVLLNGRRPDVFELREQARALIGQLSQLIPAEALADDMAKDFAVRDLLGQPIW
jgi:hypothetical protein